DDTRRPPSRAAFRGAPDRVGGDLRRDVRRRRSPRPARGPARARAPPQRREPPRRRLLRVGEGSGPPRFRAPARRATPPVAGARADDRAFASGTPARADRGQRDRDGARAPRGADGAPSMIRDDAIRAVRERASLVEVVSDVVALRRRGRSAIGLCPFHAEKTPSFTVSEERGFYHCFGCGEHGDVFAFVMKTESLAFPDAVRRVAQRFGMPLPEEAAGAARTAEPLAAANAAAAAFFRAELDVTGGARARAYLRERGLDDDVIRRFGLGWAPPGGEALARHLRTRGVRTE